jgi:hypothetical protein
MHEEINRRMKKCSNCKKPIIKDEPYMTNAYDHICMHCLKYFGNLLDKEESSGRGWHFTAPIKYENTKCSCCQELIPINVWALIIIYIPYIWNGTTPDKKYARLCLPCIYKFNHNISEEMYNTSSAKRLTVLLKKENKADVHL